MNDSTRIARARSVMVGPSARGGIDPFIVMDVMREANAREAAGEQIIHMEVGQPATPAPRTAIAAAQAAIGRERLGYTEALGLPALRERIARHYRDWYGLAIAPSRVVVTAGSSAGFVLAFLAAFDAGARVALPAPGYPCYRHILTALGCEPVMIETGPETRWMPPSVAIDAAASGSRLDGLLLASPANPTGTTLADGRLAELVAAAERNRITFISDEIYHGLTYDRPPETALAHSDELIVINSFSKYFSMTGWRIGWMVVPETLARTLERLAQNLYISPPAVSQIAAIGAFEGVDELEANKRVYAQNRALLMDALPKAGWDRILPADGAFYLYVDVGAFTSDSLTFAKAMLAEIGVAITPGVDFDPSRGRRFVRLSYAGSTADMAEAARRIAGWKR